MGTGVFTLGLQLCAPVGGVADNGLFNLSACAVSRTSTYSPDQASRVLKEGEGACLFVDPVII